MYSGVLIAPQQSDYKRHTDFSCGQGRCCPDASWRRFWHGNCTSGEKPECSEVDVNMCPSAIEGAQHTTPPGNKKPIGTVNVNPTGAEFAGPAPVCLDDDLKNSWVQCNYASNPVQTLADLKNWVANFRKDANYTRTLQEFCASPTSNPIQNCPIDARTGKPMVSCSRFIAKGEEGTYCKNWVNDKSTATGTVTAAYQTYCTNYADSPDCRCLNRRYDPLYKAITSSAAGAPLTSESCWWGPCQDPAGYLVTPDLLKPVCPSSICQNINNIIDSQISGGFNPSSSINCSLSPAPAPGPTACSAQNPTGTCPSGQQCQNGTCTSSSQTTCSTTNPKGTCPSGTKCNDGVCTGTPNKKITIPWWVWVILGVVVFFFVAFAFKSRSRKKRTATVQKTAATQQLDGFRGVAPPRDPRAGNRYYQRFRTR